MDTILIKALQLILSLSILVIIHECGHFLFAKLFKVRVEKFYLFFNPWFSLFKFKPKGSETEYGIGWLPLGGYVKISGMIDESMDKEAMKLPPQPWEFRTKPAWQRLLIMVGGVLMNFILAFFIYSMMVLAWGEEYLPVKNVKMGFSFNETTLKAGFQNGDIPITADGVSIEKMDVKTIFAFYEAKEIQVLRQGEIVTLKLPENFDKGIFEGADNFSPRYPFVIERVSSGSPAGSAGLEAGDSIVGVNGTEMAINEIQAALVEYKEKEMTLNLYRNGKKMDVLITPTEFGKIGVNLRSPYKIYETVKKNYNFFTAFPAGIRIGVQQIKDYLGQFKYIFTKEGAQSLGGFGAIGNLFPAQWDWASFWSMTAFLSIILGVMNLLPIPALDGGHVMFLFYEIITRREPPEKFMEYAQTVGMVLLFALLIYANGMDIFRAFFK
ncbi:MAG: RIP metalloprotease RseP [Candidatus Symbiothrix sp.]|jgi:regulator of sigma E protease|nr:RIP metalloprotease RseP [Candidatus Symbiothrix sp.]